MCGAYGFSIKDAKQVYDRFEVVNTLPDLKASFNLRPGQMNPVITAHSPNQISYMFWGLIPYFANDKNFTYKYKTINAKAETVATLRTYREPLRRRRCLIPATGFYEPDKVNHAKTPFPWHYFQLKSQDLFAFAGLYDVWTDPATKKELASYTPVCYHIPGVSFSKGFVHAQLHTCSRSSPRLYQCSNTCLGGRWHNLGRASSSRLRSWSLP